MSELYKKSLLKLELDQVLEQLASWLPAREALAARKPASGSAPALIWKM